MFTVLMFLYSMRLARITTCVCKLKYWAHFKLVSGWTKNLATAKGSCSASYNSPALIKQWKLLLMYDFRLLKLTAYMIYSVVVKKAIKSFIVPEVTFRDCSRSSAMLSFIRSLGLCTRYHKSRLHFSDKNSWNNLESRSRSLAMAQFNVSHITSISGH